LIPSTLIITTFSYTDIIIYGDKYSKKRAA